MSAVAWWVIFGSLALILGPLFLLRSGKKHSALERPTNQVTPQKAAWQLKEAQAQPKGPSSESEKHASRHDSASPLAQQESSSSSD